MGFILYPPSGFPKWNTDDHDQMMVVTVLFTMHLAIILMFEKFVDEPAAIQVRKMKLDHVQLRESNYSRDLLKRIEAKKALAKEKGVMPARALARQLK